MKQISNALILVLAVIAAIVATELIIGYPTWPMIVLYWMTLTMKNIVDYIGTKDHKTISRWDDDGK